MFIPQRQQQPQVMGYGQQGALPMQQGFGQQQQAGMVQSSVTAMGQQQQQRSGLSMTQAQKALIIQQQQQQGYHQMQAMGYHQQQRQQDMHSGDYSAGSDEFDLSTEAGRAAKIARTAGYSAGVPGHNMTMTSAVQQQQLQHHQQLQQHQQLQLHQQLQQQQFLQLQQAAVANQQMHAMGHGVNPSSAAASAISGLQSATVSLPVTAPASASAADQFTFI
jgi:hypothetical protein